MPVEGSCGRGRSAWWCGVGVAVGDLHIAQAHAGPLATFDSVPAFATGSASEADRRRACLRRVVSTGSDADRGCPGERSCGKEAAHTNPAQARLALP